MAVKDPQRRTRRIPLWVFFVYGLLALLIAAGLVVVTVAGALETRVVLPPTEDNPFGLPFWVFQVLFVFTAVTGIASFVRWIVGAVSAVIRFVRRK